MRLGTWWTTGVRCAALLAAVTSVTGAQEDVRTVAGFDPAAGLGMLTEASANQDDPSGAFTGLVTQIEVDPLFGTSTSSIPIALPPGRKGLTPDLSLRYSSNGGNGLFGAGWDLPLGCIKRNATAGVPLDYTQATAVYDDGRGFVLVLRGGTIVLDRCLSPGGGSEHLHSVGS
jgi:hypothetical protein